MNEENEFFLRKLELDYGDKKAQAKIKLLAKKVSWLKGWPTSRAAFWNGESFMWGNKISKERRELIKKELKFLGRNPNLDLGCGSHSYLRSVGFDISQKMLLLNHQLVERMAGDVEKKLPFKQASFNSATMVFLLDYVKNYTGLLQEVYRILQKKGKLVVVQSKTRVNPWQRQQAVNNHSLGKWKQMLEKAGFKVNFYEKEGLGFYRCLKE